MPHTHLLVRVAHHARNSLPFLYPAFAPLHTSAKPLLTCSKSRQVALAEDQEPAKQTFTFYRNPDLPPPASSSSTPDVDQLVQQCRSTVHDGANTEAACRSIIAASRQLIDVDVLSAASVVQDMLNATGWPAVPDLVHHIEDLIAHLTLHHKDNRRPIRSFASDAHYTAAASLIRSMRASEIPRTQPMQTALLRAMLRSQRTAAAVQFYAAEVQAWWDAEGTSKPRAQALRDIRQSLTSAEKGLADSKADKVEYAQALVVLCRLLAVGRLPVPQATSPADIVWLISACCRFEASARVSQREADLHRLAETIRGYMAEYIQTLPSGRSDDDVRPPLDLHSYNQLIHYSMAVLRSVSLCKHIFAHMVHTRSPPLAPDTVTFNTILRQATVQGYDGLARTVLTAEPVAPPQLQQPPDNAMLLQADAAIARADSHRLVALTQYITTSSLFLPCYREEPGYVSASDWIMRIYPSLHKTRYARQAASFADPNRLDRRLRLPADRAGRLAILDPRVLTAVLNLAAKAGKTGLALRVWRLLKRTSLQSSPLVARSDVSDGQWAIPVQAATIVMQVLAREALRHPDAPSSAPTSRFDLRSGAARRRALVAHGWNLAASTRTEGPRRMAHPAWRTRVGEGMRWISARLLAQREYAFLLHHWGLLPSLAHHRHSRLTAWEKPPQPVERGQVVPDAHFFSVVLGIFGRQHPYVRTRLPFVHTPGDEEHEALLHTVAARLSTPDRPCDPFLLVLLLDLEALGLPIPPAYHSILPPP